jgi:hypothetical protein
MYIDMYMCICITFFSLIVLIIELIAIDYYHLHMISCLLIYHTLLYRIHMIVFFMRSNVSFYYNHTYICIYIYTYLCIYTYTYFIPTHCIDNSSEETPPSLLDDGIYIHIYIYICIYMFIYIHIYIYIYAYYIYNSSEETPPSLLDDGITEGRKR